MLEIKFWEYSGTWYYIYIYFFFCLLVFLPARLEEVYFNCTELHSYNFKYYKSRLFTTRKGNVLVRLTNLKEHHKAVFWLLPKAVDIWKFSIMNSRHNNNIRSKSLSGVNYFSWSLFRDFPKIACTCFLCCSRVPKKCFQT